MFNKNIHILSILVKMSQQYFWHVQNMFSTSAKISFAFCNLEFIKLQQIAKTTYPLTFMAHMLANIVA